MSENPLATLSVIIPCFNEAGTLARCVERLREIRDGNLALQVLIVDDGSTDGSVLTARELAARYPDVGVVTHDHNAGKGAAIRSGIAHATGDYVAVQDADLEYSPEDLKRLLQPLINNEADVVFGSRFTASGPHRVLYFWHSIGNRLLTFLSNMMTDVNLTDMEVGYKVFRRDVLRGITIEENRFGFEPEIVAKVAQRKVRLYELGVSYHGRSYSEGKKIRMTDAVRALYCIVKYSLHTAPWPSQLLCFLVIALPAWMVNAGVFTALLRGHRADAIAAGIWSFLAASPLTMFYYLTLLARLHRTGRSVLRAAGPLLVLFCLGGLLDVPVAVLLTGSQVGPLPAKLLSSALCMVLLFFARRMPSLQLKPDQDWQPQLDHSDHGGKSA